MLKLRLSVEHPIHLFHSPIGLIHLGFVANPARSRLFHAHGVPF
jgi:hypothetical protein